MTNIFTSTKRILVISFAILASTMSAMASPIFVSNFSFETLPPGGLPNGGCGAGCSFSDAAIAGWTNASGSGQFQTGPQAGNFTYFNSVDDGITTAYSNGPTISQTVGATVQAGILYTLMVDLGSRKDIGPHASAALIVNGNTYTATGSFVAGGWNTFTATYLGTSTDAGSSITIALLSSGPQANFDNVRLSDSTTVPEPATLAFLGLGLAAGAIFRRAKSARQ